MRKNVTEQEAMQLLRDVPRCNSVTRDVHTVRQADTCMGVHVEGRSVNALTVDMSRNGGVARTSDY